MAEELKDVRFKVTAETLAIISAKADASGRDLSQYLRMLCEKEANEFIHAVSLADKRLRAQGTSGILGEHQK